MVSIAHDNYIEIRPSEGCLLTNKERDFFKDVIFVPKNCDYSDLLIEVKKEDLEKVNQLKSNNNYESVLTKLDDLSRVVAELSKIVSALVYDCTNRLGMEVNQLDKNVKAVNEGNTNKPTLVHDLFFNVNGELLKIYKDLYENNKIDFNDIPETYRSMIGGI